MDFLHVLGQSGRYGDLSKDPGTIIALQFCSDCITATRGMALDHPDVVASLAVLDIVPT